MHLLWAPPYPTGFSFKGFAIDRRVSDQEDRADCFKVSDTVFDQARRRGFVQIDEAIIWAYPHDQADPAAGPWTYRLDLPGRHRVVTVRGPGGIAAFAGRRDGQVVDGQWFVGTECRLEGGPIDVVWIVANSIGPSFEICADVVHGEDWFAADRIVDGLQMPFMTVNPALADETDEEALASDQALPGFIAGDWLELSKYANAALQRPFRQPSWRVTTARPGNQGDEWDLSPFGLVAAAMIAPDWQRALGFAHLDTDGLVPDTVYDYRLTGTIPRRDRDEIQLDFHTVPRRYRLPSHFWLGEVALWFPTQPTVDAENPPASAVEPIWKGVRFDEWIRLALPVPTDQIIVSGTSPEVIDFIGFASGSEVASVAFPLEERTEVDFGTPVDTVLMVGKGFFTAVIPRPIAAGLDPHELVEISEVVLGVRFSPTAPPHAPVDIAVENLGSPSRSNRIGTPDFNRGFEVSWEPPPKIDPLLNKWWPVDATAAPPTEIARYTLERRWSTVPFHGRDDTDGFHVSSRNAEPVTDNPEPGFDVLRAFPPANQGGLAAEPLVRAIDVLPDDEPNFGEMVTYRVHSIDAIGRSSSPLTSGPTQLQKLRRPPPPTTPPSVVAPPAGLAPPVGVQVRLLQADDPDLSAADQALAAGTDIVVVRWGWGPEDRRVDPHVTEFRLYEHDGPLLDVAVEITGPPVALLNGWSLPCRFDEQVRNDQFAGHRAQLNHPFVIVSHGIGPVTNIVLASPTTNPAATPSGDGFSLTRTDGRELDPSHWSRRVRVEPRTGPPADPGVVEAYQVILPASWISVSPGNRIQRAWIGVAAADAESYVPDRRAAVEATPRPGNESTVAAIEVVARHRGRPNLAIANLGPIESLSSGRRLGNEVHGSFSPADHLPTAATIGAPMRLERIAAGKILPRLVVDDTAIQILASNGSLSPWVLSATDAADLRNQYATGPVSDRFLAHVAAQLDGLEADATGVGDIDPTSRVEDVLPNNPGRWVYRLRAVDRAGKLSITGQVLQMVMTVPSPSRAINPELVDLDLVGDLATLTVRHRAGSQSELLVFHSIDPRVMPARASLATVRNRPDLDPLEVIVVRDDRGRRLTGQTMVPGVDDIATASFTVPEGNRFLVWAVAVSDEGLPSRLTGPLHVTHGLPPEVN